jgi:hypothetical protein
MTDPRPELSETYREMSDDELVERWTEGHLTEIAKEVARAEFARRGMAVPARTAADDEDDTPDGTAAEETVVFETVARSLIPSDLHILCARLEADGIPAFVVDDNITRMNSLWSVAVGGARLLVPQSFATEAKQIIGYVRSGRFRLREGDDTR